MATTKKSVKVKESEDLSPANIERVIVALKAEKPITKKQACEMLRISYNVSRLQTIIDNFLDKKKHEEEQRAKKRYKPATDAEVSYAIESYLRGDSVAQIARTLYRSDQFVNNILSRVGVPKRTTGSSYFNPELLPEECVKTEFNPGEKVYSARYDSLATIRYKVQESYGRNVYSIYLEDEKWQQFAYQPAEELGSLEHLKQYGVIL